MNIGLNTVTVRYGIFKMLTDSIIIVLELNLKRLCDIEL